MNPTPKPTGRFRPSLFAYAILASLAVWGMIAFGASRAFAADPLAWGRTYAVADSLVVPVRWNASCDARGCADSYRVTWTLRGTVDATPPASTLPRSGSSRDTTPLPPTAPQEVVLREVITTLARDSALVSLPEIGMPRHVCVYITAIRRGIPSEVSSSCRTVEAPDKAPPAVDSIRWDSLGIPKLTPPLFDSLIPAVSLLPGAHQYALASDSAGALWLDSLPLAPNAMPYVGYAAVACGVVRLRADSSPIVVLPLANASNAEQVARYRDRCAASVRRAYGVTSVRSVADAITFRAGVQTPAVARDAERGA